MKKQKPKKVRAVNGKRLIVSLVFVFIMMSLTVFAVGAPELFSSPKAADTSKKQCDCNCFCEYCLSGECTFKRGAAQ